ncbi:MAG: hypothetical protein ACW98G_15605 [Candidatus Hodarchaeales archaeon]|jgi:hypothetical protein
MENRKFLVLNMSSTVIGLCFLLILLIPQVSVAITNEDIPIDSEYASGIITQQDTTMKISYAWVNSNSSEFLSITMFDDIYKVALFRPFFGQSYKVDNSEFFVGTVLTGFELFQDTNGNNVLDQAEELKYYIMLNASQEYILPTIEKTIVDNVTKYNWKVCYLEIDGFFNPYEGPYMARTIIDSLNLSYIYEIHENHTELKLAIEMGEWDAYEFDFGFNPDVLIRIEDIDLSEYSLSLLFGTTVSSEESFELTQYNGSTGLEDLRVEVNGVPIFQSLFQDTYDLGLNGSAYQATTTPASVDTLYDDQLQFWGTPASFYSWWQDWFPSMSNLTSVPAIGLEEVSFLYRICYPTWGGEAFNHDPRYRALFDGELNLPTTTTNPTSNPKTTTTEITSIEISAAFFAIVLLAIPFTRKRRN